jgi:hypothetical protein
MSEVVRWQLDMPVQRAKELDALEEQYGFSSRKDLMNTALSLLQWAIEEVKGGRILASVDEKTQRYKELVLPAFQIASAEANEAKGGALSAASAVADLDAFESALVNSPADHTEAIQKLHKAKELVEAARQMAAA